MSNLYVSVYIILFDVISETGLIYIVYPLIYWITFVHAEVFFYEYHHIICMWFPQIRTQFKCT